MLNLSGKTAVKNGDYRFQTTRLMSRVNNGSSIYIIVCLNPVAGETDTSNNCSSEPSSALFVRYTDFDWRVSGVSATDTTVRPDAQIQGLSATVQHNGDGSNDLSPSHLLGMYFSEDATISTADLRICDISVPELAGGASTLVSPTSCAVPMSIISDTQDTTYYVGACMDGSLAADYAVEKDETNNCSAGIAVQYIVPYLELTAPESVVSGTAFDLQVSGVDVVNYSLSTLATVSASVGTLVSHSCTDSSLSLTLSGVLEGSAVTLTLTDGTLSGTLSGTVDVVDVELPRSG